MSFDFLGLSAAVLRGVAEQGYTQPTPIQSRVIPAVLQGRDVMAGAQTGTGKTAAFALPILERLSATAGKGRRRVRALILTPTRELAAQVAESVRAYGRHVPLRSAVVFGGVSARTQTAELGRGVDIVVATPGRLLDHAGQGAIDLSSVETFVVDEADRMLDMGFLPDVRRIMALLPACRQNLLFSATFPNDIRKLAAKLLHEATEIEVSRRNAAADNIEHVVHRVDKAQKRTALASLMRTRDLRQVLVFTRTKRGADRLARQLEQDGFKAAAIHGNKSQGARTRVLAAFKQDALHVLVATDIAARGLDIDELPLVVNFELPDVAEYYVHRIGRTGRAGHAGLAVSLVCNDELPQLAAIERLLGAPIEHRRAQSPAAGARSPDASHVRRGEPRESVSTSKVAESSQAAKRDRAEAGGKRSRGRSRATRRRVAATLQG